MGKTNYANSVALQIMQFLLKFEHRPVYRTSGNRTADRRQAISATAQLLVCGRLTRSFLFAVSF